MLASHQTQLQQPPGMSVLRRQRARPVRTADTVFTTSSFDVMLQRRGVDALISGYSRPRIGPALVGEPRQAGAPLLSTFPMPRPF